MKTTEFEAVCKILRSGNEHSRLAATMLDQLRTETRCVSCATDRDGGPNHAILCRQCAREEFEALRAENDGLRSEIGTQGVVLTAARCSSRLLKYENAKLGKALGEIAGLHTPATNQHARAVRHIIEEALKPAAGTEGGAG